MANYVVVFRCSSSGGSTHIRRKSSIRWSSHPRSDLPVGVHRAECRSVTCCLCFSYYRSNEVRRFTYTRLFVNEDDRDATSDIAVGFQRLSNRDLSSCVVFFRNSPPKDTSFLLPCHCQIPLDGYLRVPRRKWVVAFEQCSTGQRRLFRLSYLHWRMLSIYWRRPTENWKHWWKRMRAIVNWVSLPYLAK